MNIIDLDVNMLENLLLDANKNGTLDKWALVALEWMKQAEQEINRLRDQIST